MRKLIVDLRKEHVRQTVLDLIQAYDAEYCNDDVNDGDVVEVDRDNVEEYIDTICSQFGTLSFYLIGDYGDKFGTDDLEIGKIHLVEEMPDNEYGHMYIIACGEKNVLSELKKECEEVKLYKKQLKKLIKSLE